MELDGCRMDDTAGDPGSAVDGGRSQRPGCNHCHCRKTDGHSHCHRRNLTTGHSHYPSVCQIFFFHGGWGSSLASA